MHAARDATQASCGGGGGGGEGDERLETARGRAREQQRPDWSFQRRGEHSSREGKEKKRGRRNDRVTKDAKWWMPAKQFEATLAGAQRRWKGSQLNVRRGERGNEYLR